MARLLRSRGRPLSDVTLVEAAVRRLAGQSSERASATASSSEATSPA